MTIIIASLTPSAAYLTTDRLYYGKETTESLPGIGIAGSYEEAVASTFMPVALPLIAVGEVEKLFVFPAMNAAMAGAGDWASIAAWGHMLRAAAGSLVEIATLAAPKVLRSIAAEHGNAEFATFLVGWDQREQRPVGWAFASSTNFEPCEFVAGYHSMMPVIDPEATNYESIRGMWADAATGCGTLEFHRMCAGAHAESSRRGRLKAVVDGRTVTAIISAEGTDVR